MSSLFGNIDLCSILLCSHFERSAAASAAEHGASRLPRLQQGLSVERRVRGKDEKMVGRKQALTS